jgi:hypothetical protein
MPPASPPDPTNTWADRMRTEAASRYLKDKHGLPVEEKTLRNWRASDRGPRCRYLGTLPLYDRTELDRWAEEDALQPECPTRRTRRLARAATGLPQATCGAAGAERRVSELKPALEKTRALPAEQKAKVRAAKMFSQEAAE